MTTLREWLTARFEMPFAKAAEALVIVGGKGSGKTTAARLIAREFPKGRTFFVPRHETTYMGRVAGIDKRYLAIVDEVDPKDLWSFKHFITSTCIKVSPKAADAFTVPFNVNFILTTSDADVLSPDIGERRFIFASPTEVFATLADMPRNHS